MPLRPQEEGDRLGSLSTSTRLHPAHRPAPGRAPLPRAPGWQFSSQCLVRPAGARRPRTVSKDRGGVSSFLYVFTLGLFLVDFSTFISLVSLSSPESRENSKASDPRRGPRGLRGYLTRIVKSIGFY